MTFKQFRKLVFLLLALPVSCHSAPRLLLWGGENNSTFLGVLNDNPYTPDSIWNEFGTYGNPFNSDSIWNEVGRFGSEVSPYSPFNDVALKPPAIKDEHGKFYGYLTTNLANGSRATFPLALKMYANFSSIRRDISKWAERLNVELSSSLETVRPYDEGRTNVKGKLINVPRNSNVTQNTERTHMKANHPELDENSPDKSSKRKSIKTEFREWHDLRNNVICARMVSINEGRGVIGLEKEGSTNLITVLLSRLSEEDKNYIASYLKKMRATGHVVYKGGLFKVVGGISKDAICLDSEVPLIIRTSDLSREDQRHVEALLKNHFKTRPHDMGIEELTEDFILGKSAMAMLDPYVERVFQDGALVYLTLGSGRLRIRGPSKFLNFHGLNQDEFSINAKAPPHHEWYAGKCYRTLDSIETNYTFVVSRIEDAVSLLYGWVEQHKNDQLIVDAIQQHYNSLNLLTSVSEKDIRGNWIKLNLSATGTAFAITPDGYLLTCYHVVKSARKVLLKSKYVHAFANVVAVDSRLDIALLKIAEEDIKTVSISQTKGASGNVVYSFGFPLIDEQGLSIKVTKGSIDNGVEFYGDTSCCRISAPVYPGCSGGPILDDKGVLVGMVHGGIPEKQIVNSATKASCIMDFLELNLQSRVKELKANAVSHKDQESMIYNAKRSTMMVLVYK